MNFLKSIFQRYYIPPVKISLEDYTYMGKYRSYSDYNYLQGGLSSFLKIMHFEQALKMTRAYFNKVNVIDFACADGPFLPSLSRHFHNVVAIDHNPDLVRLASKLVQEMHLDNVTVICNADLIRDDVKSKLGGDKYHILYLLETLEHVGDKSAPWDSRVHFVKELTGFIEKDGIIVVTVPRMVGLPFLLQRLGLLVLNKERETISMADLLRASLFNDTKNLESRWDHGHLGFNHKKLEVSLKNNFQIIKKNNTIFRVTYILAAHQIQAAR
jgi:2-polyprenyl-3-methyl-5-hydroxy-6-metoxy-1,4-benzoquinol methylase